MKARRSGVMPVFQYPDPSRPACTATANPAPAVFVPLIGEAHGDVIHTAAPDLPDSKAPVSPEFVSPDHGKIDFCLARPGASPSHSHRLMLLDHHGLHRSAQRGWHCRSTTEAYDQVGALVSQSEGCGKLRSHCLNLDRLVYKRITDAQRRGLQRESLIAAADFNPVRLIGGLAYEYGDTGGAAGLARILVVLPLWLEQ